jgi:hypothetical protein
MIKASPEYLQAALLAILPYITDFAQKVELAIPVPVTTNHVRRFFLIPMSVQGETKARRILSLWRGASEEHIRSDL